MTVLVVWLPVTVVLLMIGLACWMVGRSRAMMAAGWCFIVLALGWSGLMGSAGSAIVKLLGW